MNKPKRGDCGTCHWFEVAPEQPPRGPRLGSCLVNPPTPIMVQEQRAKNIGPRGPEYEVRNNIMGMVSPTQEDRRCEKWHPFGVLTPAARASSLGVADGWSEGQRDNETAARNGT